MKNTKYTKEEELSAIIPDTFNIEDDEYERIMRAAILISHTYEGLLASEKIISQVGKWTREQNKKREHAVKPAPQYESEPEESHSIVPHFSMAASDYYLTKALECLKQAKWLQEKIRLKDWIYRLTGRWTGKGKPSEKPILLGSINQCRMIVKNFVFGGRKVSSANWDKTEQIFIALDGDIRNVRKADKTPTGSADFFKFLQNNDPFEEPTEE